MSILHRHTLSLAFTRWAMLLFIGLFLIHLGDLLNASGDYVGAMGAGRGTEVLHYFALRFPSFLAAWLPISVAAAALLTAWPLLKQGTLVALCAAGIPVRRVFASLLLLALGIGAVGFVLQDQVVTRLAPEVKFAKARMEGKLKLNQGVGRSLGWHDGGRFWCAQNAIPEEGRYHQVAVFTTAASAQRGPLVMAESLLWRDGTWHLVKPVVVASYQGPVALHDEARLTDLGLSLGTDAATLVERLKQDRTRPSQELFAVGSQNAWGYLMLRLCYGLLPLLCLMFALPGFIRIEGRNHLGMQMLRSIAWMVVPLLGYWVLSRILISNSTHVITGTVVVLGSLIGVAGWRWWTMRV
jgi:lipopolysaccharide export LptBFGC system permease protein LptF